MWIVPIGLLSTVVWAAGHGGVQVAPHVRLQRVHFEQNLLPDRGHAGFGTLLYDAAGRLVLHNGHETWLYTSGLSEAPAGGQRDWYGKWISFVREFDVKTLASGPSVVALGLSGADRWAVIHDAIQISPGLSVAFYSANGVVRAAVSERPDAPFRTVPGFRIAVTEDWEKLGGREHSLESNGAHVLIDDNEAGVTLWLGYDSYHVDRTAGQLGWAQVRIDKASRDVTLIAKSPQNPLPLLRKDYLAARCGGNLATDVRLGNQHAFFYYSRPDRQKIMLTVALSRDPLFRQVSRVVELEPPLGDERVIEKFESYMLDGELHVIYENKLAANHWGTGIRIYKITE